jgi:uncharacterized protein
MNSSQSPWRFSWAQVTPNSIGEHFPMTPQERELILAMAQRLRDTPLTEKDSEAERLIQTTIGSQPNALYLLTQAVIVQEQGLRHAQERIQQLESQQSKPGGFLSNWLGGGFSVPPSASYPTPSAAGGSAAGSFLRTAAATAAGVVGAELIYDGLRHAFGGSGFGHGGVPPVVSQPNQLTEQPFPLGEGARSEEDEDSMQNEEALAGGGDFDSSAEENDDGGSDFNTDTEDYDESDSF